ncbi:hypothetical protein AKG11_30945 [Shinella sp. SUS2]|uniref:hypothetical protein n=1 Tax=unclassified Shinella TaxID=2643062 RepID=UPI00068329E6|nr:MULTISPECIES: hypothetical protein [unclassified Shinella]KNY13094.1 hypothetical protein AKG11_30945 [Shinella sp. SUS2]KOC71879.1 hypothetical protein AKG10_30365 [Shinella sp. GWS1]
MSKDHSHFASNPTRNRSAISNGSWLLEGVDNRSALGRRFRDLCVSFADGLGGEPDLTEPQRAMIRQAAAVTVQSEKLQASIVKGEDVDHEKIVRLNNLQARLIKQLGIGAKRGRPKARQSVKERLIAKRESVA